MEKEDILKASQKENKKRDLVELDVVKQANNYAALVGTIACCMILVLASVVARTMLYSPWFIYFSMMGTNWLIRSVRLKKKTDWILTSLFIVLALLALVGCIIRLLGVVA